MNRNLKFSLLFIGILVLCESLAGLIGVYFKIGIEWPDSYFVGAGFVALPALGIAFLIARRKFPPSTTFGVVTFIMFIIGTSLHFFLGLVPPEGKFLLYPDIDTEFAPGYTDESYVSIKIGMTESNVVKFLGTPMSTQERSSWPFPGDADIIWWYSSDGACSWGDFAWRAPIVGFKNGVVVSKWTVWCYD